VSASDTSAARSRVLRAAAASAAGAAAAAAVVPQRRVDGDETRRWRRAPTIHAANTLRVA